MAKTVSGEEHKALVKHTKSDSTAPSLPKPVLFGVAVLVVAGLSFAGGMQYQKHHSPKIVTTSTSGQRNNAQLGPNAQNGFGGRRRSGGQRPITGQVTAIDTASITITDQNSTSTTYAISDTTTVTDNGQSATIAGIKTGNTVAIIVSPTDAKQAVRILLNPNLGGAPSGGSTNANNPSSIN